MDSSYQPSDEITNQHEPSLPIASTMITESVVPFTPSNDEDINKMDNLDSSATTWTMDDEGATCRPMMEVAINISPHLRNLSNIKVLEKKFNDGYDSDGEIGLFKDMEELEGHQMHDEEDLPVENLPTMQNQVMMTLMM